MDKAIYDLGREQYRQAVGAGDENRDEEGFFVLRPTAEHVDKQVESLTTSIDSLEAKLKLFRAEKAKAVKYQKSDDYKESKKKSKAKKNKKARTALLEMVFNNADANAEADEDDEENYRDNKKRSYTKKKDTTLDTTYGMRFAPVVSMLYDSVTEFDRIAADIEEELNSTRGQTRSMYRSNQIGNLLSAKKNRLDAVKELGSIARTVSDLEYKKDKDRRADEGADSTKMITSIGAKFLRGAFDEEDKYSKKKKKKGKDDSYFSKSAKGIKGEPRKEREDVDDDRELAKEFAKTLMDHREDISLTPHERYINMEGKYQIVVVCDALDPENTWRFMAIDPKTGREIDGFKEKYKGLMPKKKSCRMRFDTIKKSCTDLNTSIKYKMMFFD